MAAIEDFNTNLPGTPNRGHQRTKSSVLKSWMHRRNNSDGSALPPSASIPTTFYDSGPNFHGESEQSLVVMGLPGFPIQGRALGELQQNQQDQTPRSPKKSKGERRDGQKSPKKTGFGTLSLKSHAAKDSAKLAKSKENSPAKPKKAKSSTNLAGLLSRPKSLKNLHKLASDEEARAAKDKENRTPPNSLGADAATTPPIYAQFCSDPAARQQIGMPSQFDRTDNPFATPSASFGKSSNDPFGDGVVLKQRPNSFQPPYVTRHESSQSIETNGREGKRSKKDVAGSQRSSTWGRKDKTTRPKASAVFPGLSQKSKTPKSNPADPVIDPKDIDTHLEAMLDRRNIPENQRYKMRNLTSTIKMEFIRQDWAETQAKNLERPRSHDSDTSMEGPTPGPDQEKAKTKHSRVKSLTLSKGGSKTPTPSPSKKKPEGTLGRHFRSKSTDSVASDRPTSSGLSSTNIFSKIKLQHSPSDFVSYLGKVQKPELVEVGKLHKLRLLLRNETVAWTEEFIKQGGMREIVGLFHRIMEVEWREEHEDALLHEDLLCLKALCTTALALQYLHSIQATLFPALIHMIFDPEKKGPSEFTTRNIITSVLFTYIQSATPQERMGRAQTILEYLRDPEGKEEERPISFVLEMRRERPYRVWCKEVVSVTKEVFWIFLHNLNVVALPADKSTKGGQPTVELGACSGGQVSTSVDQLSYLIRHFPQERPPVPAAPYVGGVEWDATNYLASHLDLMNAILACTPSSTARNMLRGQLRISGWERCLGGSLRLCKEKFYGAVHDTLRTWVAAAFEDGWDVRDVRYGPPAEARSPPKKPAGGNGGRKKDELAPKIEMPKLDFGLDAPLAAGGGKHT